MRVQEISNTSQKDVTIDLEGGSVTLVPGQKVQNVRIKESDLQAIRSKAAVKLDLSEVKGLLD